MLPVKPRYEVKSKTEEQVAPAEIEDNLLFEDEPVESSGGSSAGFMHGVYVYRYAICIVLFLILIVAIALYVIFRKDPILKKMTEVSNVHAKTEPKESKAETIKKLRATLAKGKAKQAGTVEVVDASADEGADDDNASEDAADEDDGAGEGAGDNVDASAGDNVDASAGDNVDASAVGAGEDVADDATAGDNVDVDIMDLLDVIEPAVASTLSPAVSATADTSVVESTEHDSLDSEDNPIATRRCTAKAGRGICRKNALNGCDFCSDHSQ
tara:strand:+ start:2067 stop:2876 length:810 start_codon:yes stop_codon:yes gene_type:complete